MKKLIILSIILFTQISTSFATGLKDCSDKFYKGYIPKAKETVVILCKSEMAIGYSTERKTALWVAYYITPEKTNMPPAVDKRPPFKIDTALPLTSQAQLSDYENSGYDRGHLAPFEDMNHTVLSSKESMLLSNIVPQDQNNNRGIWKMLEMKIRKDSKVSSRYIIVGPIYDANPQLTIGDGILVPSKLYKIVIEPAQEKIKAYIIPNMPISISSLTALKQFEVSLTELQKQSRFVSFVNTRNITQP